MKIVAAFGPLLLAGALLRLLTIQQAVLLAGRRFGVKAHIIPMPQPEACIDVDKPEDKDLGESIFATDRKRGVWGKSVSVRVDLGGRRINNKKKKLIQIKK